MHTATKRSTPASGALLALLSESYPDLLAQLNERLSAAPDAPPPPYPPLESVTKPNLTTAEIAYYSNQAEQTWRIHACRETYPEGLRPIRIGGRLNWPTKGAKKLLGVA